MKPKLIRWFPCGLAALLSAAEAAPRVELSAPRDFGYVMGDVIEHSVEIDVPADHTLETGFLPQAGALDDWLDVRAVDWDERRDGNTRRYRVRLEYQLFQGVRASEKAEIQALPIRFRGPEALEVRTPPWSFSILPLIPPQLDDEQVRIRGFLPAPALSTDTHRTRLSGYVTGMAAIIGLLMWVRYRKARQKAPFARALADLKPLLCGAPNPDQYRQAARRLHRALDETAGYAVFADRVDSFLAAHPVFAGARTELIGFFAWSQTLFFQTSTTTLPEYPPPRGLETFCRLCAALERRQD